MDKAKDLLFDLLKSLGGRFSKEQLNKNMSLKNDLGFDSILTVQLAINISKNYNIELEDCEIESWKTIGDIYSNLKKLGKLK